MDASELLARWDGIALAGPTASGKTAIALALAERWPVEIISVDSALVYRGMDIGTAKPSAAERAQVPHHLIDIREPTQTYSAADFARDTQALIPQIRARGRIPWLVGGTMLYFKALLEGLHDLPAAQPALRQALEDEARVQGWPALHAQLAQVDPATAARLAPQDAQRISRALEVWRHTGRALSSFFNVREVSAPRLLMLSLEPQDRSWLHARIALRFEQMLAQGLVDEVRALRARPDLHAQLPAMRCVGYRQTWQILDELPAPDAPLSAAQRQRVSDTGIAASRQLAKRQLTWLRSMPGRHRVDCDQDLLLQAVLQTMQNAA